MSRYRVMAVFLAIVPLLAGQVGIASAQGYYSYYPSYDYSYSNYPYDYSYSYSYPSESNYYSSEGDCGSNSYYLDGNCYADGSNVNQYYPDYYNNENISCPSGSYSNGDGGCTYYDETNYNPYNYETCSSGYYYNGEGCEQDSYYTDQYSSDNYTTSENVGGCSSNEYYSNGECYPDVGQYQTYSYITVPDSEVQDYYPYQSVQYMNPDTPGYTGWCYETVAPEYGPSYMYAC